MHKLIVTGWPQGGLEYVAQVIRALGNITVVERPTDEGDVFVSWRAPYDYPEPKKVPTLLITREPWAIVRAIAARQSDLAHVGMELPPLKWSDPTTETEEQLAALAFVLRHRAHLERMAPRWRMPIEELVPYGMFRAFIDALLESGVACRTHGLRDSLKRTPLPEEFNRDYGSEGFESLRRLRRQWEEG